MDSKFPSNYNKLLFESVCVNDERNVINNIITNINDTNDKSKIYQKLPQSFISEKNCTIKKVHCKNIFSINKIVDMLNSKNEIDASLSNNKKEIDKNNIFLNIPKSNKSVNEENKKDNKEKIYGNNKGEISHNNSSNDTINKLSFNNNIKNEPNDYNTDDKSPLDNTLKNENDKRKNLEENVKRKRYKKAKTESISNDIDIEFPIIRNLNSSVTDNKNNDNSDHTKQKYFQKQKLMKQIEVFNNKLLNNKEMDEFLENSKQTNEDTNDLSILDKIVLNDISKKISTKNAIDNSDTELVDANGATNSNDNNNRIFNNYSSNSSNNNINFNSNFSQFNRNISRNFNNFGDNNENRKNNEDNNITEKGKTNNDSKVKVTDKEIRQIRRDLRRATVDCSERGLFQAAKWASEQLNSITKVTESLNKYRVYKKKSKIKNNKDKNQAMD